MPGSNQTPRPRSEGSSTPRSRSGSGQPPRRRRRRTGRRVAGVVAKVVGTICLTGLLTGLLLVCFAAVYIRNVIVPKAEDQAYLGDLSIAQTSIMYYYDNDGQAQPYLTLSSDENRMWVSYDELPEDMIHALVAIEDKRFYQHHGVDWLRTGKGVLNMFTGGSIQGGSTLTQQLIKNVTGENEVTVERKILEIFRALDFEKTHSKEQILEWYLNQIYLGERCYGVGAASWVYFGKDVKELSLAQCASLVGITNNPSRYDPYLNKSLEYTNDMANRKRAKLVLDSMLDQHMIDKATYKAACDEVDTMEFVMGSPEGGGPDSVYNWYQDQVIADVVQDLKAKYGWSDQVASNKVYYGGLSIYTNVDLRVQGIVDEVYSDRSNLNFKSNSGQKAESAIVILDDQGRVVALAGGMGGMEEKTKNRAWSRASDTKRPSGSSIKPLSVYGPALNMNQITPYSVVDDVPYQMEGGSPWPVNANRSYSGLMTVNRALAQSCNTAAVRVLGDYVTPHESYQYLKKAFHISSLVDEKWINNRKYSDEGLAPLALGGQTNGVSVYEMAAAYAVFPSMGRYVPPRTYSKVVDAEGNVLLDRTLGGEDRDYTVENGKYVSVSSGQKYAIKESTAYYINEMLKGVVTGGTGTSAAFPGMTIAGKTGTTTSQKDLWFVGYTPYYTAAVWVGFDRQERISGADHPQCVMWRKVMSKVHEGLDNKAFPQPSGQSFVTAYYCMDSGKTPSAACELDPRGSRVASGRFVSGTQPVASDVCTLHSQAEICTADPITDPETGESQGRYHLAGDYCPEEDRQTISLLDYTREGAAAMATPGDNWVLLDKYEENGICRVHNAANTGPGPEAPHTPGHSSGSGPSTGSGPDEDEPYVPAGGSHSGGPQGILID